MEQPQSATISLEDCHRRPLIICAGSPSAQHGYDQNVDKESADDDRNTADSLQASRASLSESRLSLASIESHTASNVESGSVSDVSLSSTTSLASDLSDELAIKVPSATMLTLEHLNAPVDYIYSLPSKGARDILVDALNIWTQLPPAITSGIKTLVSQIHTASLIFDDIEDGSELRRGFPATHTVFGIPQSINSATFAVLQTLRKAQSLDIPNALNITLEQLNDLHIGQSYDLHWTRHVSCPTQDEYVEMVAKKTGSLFNLITRLMSAGSGTSHSFSRSLDELVGLIGLYFQIRDDYQNLNSTEYENQKGFCEDLDEGKFSFPLIHSLRQDAANLPLREALQCRKEGKGLGTPLKLLILRELRNNGSMEHTLRTLKHMEAQMDDSVRRLEDLTGQENQLMRMLLQKLRVPA